MTDIRATATIRALATLAELSANQLEEGTPHEQVIETLRKAAEAVRAVIDADLEAAGEVEMEDNASVIEDTDTDAAPEIANDVFVPVLVEASARELVNPTESQVLNAS